MRRPPAPARPVAALLAAALLAGAGCTGGPRTDPGAATTPQDAVLRHLAAAADGDVAALRRDACGPLADALGQHSDAEVRDEFASLYQPAPDRFATTDNGDGTQLVAGYYTGIADLDIAFTAEDHHGWKVCDVRRGNGPFGPLPGPFQR